MSTVKAALAATVLLAFAAPAAAQTALNFEDIAPAPGSDTVRIGNYYNGGTASNGTSGANLGISFGSAATALCLTTATQSCNNASRGGLAPGSERGGLYFDSTDGAYANVAAGFTGAVSFNYSAAFEGGSIALYSGVNGTGSFLGSLSLAVTPNGGCSGYGSAFCPFVTAGRTFNGTARSIGFAGSAVSIVFDDLTFGSLTPGAAAAVPEPATWVMTILGFGMAGYALRRRRDVVRRVHA